MKFSAEGGGQDQTGQRPGPADRQLAPLAVAWGIVGLCLLLAVELTSLARTHLPRLLWRRVHYAGFALFVTTTAHALGAGTDSRSPAFLLAVVAVCALVAVLTAARVARSLRRPPGRRPEPGAAACTGLRALPHGPAGVTRQP